MVDAVWTTGGDWRAAMLRNPVMQCLPSEYRVRVMASVEQVEFAAGEKLVRVDSPGDYFYLLVSGECRVLRSLLPGQAAVEVDRVVPGGSFGEEALLSGLPRNATVEAVTDSRLLRLPVREFQRFLREPLVQTASLVDLAQAVRLIDVRSVQEFDCGHLPAALNLPLRDLRQQCAELDVAVPSIVYCDSGRRSASATFLLRERGFHVRWLEGGVPAALLIER